MPRQIAVVLVVTLVLAPTAFAAPPDRAESPFSGWLNPLWGALDRVLSWVPSIRSEPRRNGATVVPSGIQTAPAFRGDRDPQERIVLRANH